VTIPRLHHLPRRSVRKLVAFRVLKRSRVPTLIRRCFHMAVEASVAVSLGGTRTFGATVFFLGRGNVQSRLKFSCSLPLGESTFLSILLHSSECYLSSLCPVAFENAVGPSHTQGTTNFQKVSLVRQLVSSSGSLANSSGCQKRLAQFCQELSLHCDNLRIGRSESVGFVLENSPVSARNRQERKQEQIPLVFAWSSPFTDVLILLSSFSPRDGCNLSRLH
jgi:hypothetical protein